MRALPSAITDSIAARHGLVARLLVWIVARDRATGDPAPVGLWSGSQDATFDVAGAPRSYFGAGALLAVEPITSEAGVSVRVHHLTVSPLSEDVALVLRGYDPRRAPVEINVAYFDPDTHGLLADPVRVFRGEVDQVQIQTPEIGGLATATIILSSDAQALTRPLAVRRSDESLRRRNPGDGFRKYSDISGSVETAWGELRAKAPPPMTATPAEPPPEGEIRGP